MRRANRRRSCEGKVRHETPQAARMALRKCWEPGMQMYHCRFCGAWHLGHGGPAARRQGRRHSNRRLARMGM